MSDDDVLTIQMARPPFQKARGPHKRDHDVGRRSRTGISPGSIALQGSRRLRGRTPSSARECTASIWRRPPRRAPGVAGSPLAARLRMNRFFERLSNNPGCSRAVPISQLDLISCRARSVAMSCCLRRLTVAPSAIPLSNWNDPAFRPRADSRATSSNGTSAQRQSDSLRRDGRYASSWIVGFDSSGAGSEDGVPRKQSMVS